MRSKKALTLLVIAITLAVSRADISSGYAWERFPTGTVLIHRAEDFGRAVNLPLSRPPSPS